MPFCRRRCSYCDFYFEIGAATGGFVDGIARELDRRAGELAFPAATLSLGGGTPSQLPVADLARLVDLVRAVGLAPDAEISLEVNPEDIDGAFAAGLADAGFTRVSVGLQSFDDDVLRYLGRAHDGAHGRRAVAALVEAGLDVGVDLIVGVPVEQAARLERDVALTAALGVVHLSTYVLTVEPGTPLVQLITRGSRRAVDDDQQADAYEAILGLAEAHGYTQYEVSSHARPGHASRHNRLYWQRGAYLGLGPGAHSFRVDDDGRAIRRHTTARLADWREALGRDVDAAHEIEVLQGPHALREAVAFGLRDLGVGVDVEALAALHKSPVREPLRRALAVAIARGDAVESGGRVRLTRQGARFADRVGRDVLDDDEDDGAVSAS